MNTYLIVKTLHIISSVVMVGTGFGTAFYLFWANRSGSVAAQAVVAKWVMKADWWFTTPAVIFQPLSGIWLLHQMGMPFTWDGAWLWVKWTLALYALAACGLVANQNGENGARCLCQRRKYFAQRISPLPTGLGMVGLSRIFGDVFCVLSDGSETDVVKRGSHIQAA